MSFVESHFYSRKPAEKINKDSCKLATCSCPRVIYSGQVSLGFGVAGVTSLYSWFFYQLAAVFCITPLHADCEREFSVQNVIKTHKRNC